MKIEINTKYSIGDYLYKLKENGTIEKYKVNSISAKYNSASKGVYSIEYIIQEVHSIYTMVISENRLTENGYFPSKQDIIKLIADQL